MKTLERSLGLTSVIAISMSAMIGSGIFVLPGLAAAKTGASVWLAYLAAAICLVPPVLSKSELATAMPTSGGDYVYLERTFGPLTGTIAGVGLWLSLLLKSSFALVGFAAYLHVLAPQLSETVVALVVLVLITALNIFGVKAISKAQKTILFFVLASLACVCLFAVPGIQPSHYEPMFSKGSSGFVSAVAFVYLSFAGVTKIAAIAEEVEDPGKNLPRAMLLSLALVTVCYVGVSYVLVGIIPPETLKKDIHPVYTLATHFGSKSLNTFIAVLAVITMSSMATAGLLASSRFPLAMSRDKLLPSAFKGLNDRFGTPVNAIILTTAGMALAIMTLPVEQIAKLTSAFMILLFVGVNITVLVLRETASHWYKPTFLSPLYPFTQIVGAVSGLTLLVVLGKTGLFAICTVTAIGGMVYYGYGRRQTTRLGVITRLSGRNRPVSTLKTGEAAVIVPLFGHERSPEILVEMGAALTNGKKVEVLQIYETLEQNDLGQQLEDDPHSRAIERRLMAMAQEESLDISVETIVTRDSLHSIDKAAAKLHCHWVVIEPEEPSPMSLTLQNPIGWLQDHLHCNLAVFNDTGIRYVRKILVVAEPGPHDSLVVNTADRLASILHSKIYFIAFKNTQISGESFTKHCGYLEGLQSLCKAESEILSIEGEDWVEAIVAETVNHDLLVMGASTETSWSSKVFGTRENQITKKSECSTLLLKTPQGTLHSSHELAKLSATGGDFLRFFDSACVLIQVAVPDKHELFRLISKTMAATMAGVSSNLIWDGLQAREKVQNTSVAPGVAIPHITLPEAQTIVLGLYILNEPIDYGRDDGHPVNIVFVSIGPPDMRVEQIRLLSSLAKLIAETPLRESFENVETEAELEAELVRLWGTLGSDSEH